MAAVAKSGTPSLSTRNPCPGHYVGSNLLAGAAISAGDPCYIASTGLVQRSIGTTADAAAKVDGWAAGAAASGEAVTLLTDVEFHWGSGMTPGARMYLSLTAGTLSDATTAGGTGAVAKAIDATRIRVWASTY
jgi:hypothetical protein